MIYHPVVLLMN